MAHRTNKKTKKKPWRKGSISRAITPYRIVRPGPAQGGEAGDAKHLLLGRARDQKVSFIFIAFFIHLIFAEDRHVQTIIQRTIPSSTDATHAQGCVLARYDARKRINAS